MTHHTPNLPQKPCAACGRPFAWRKKWARDWDNVKTCSERCKGDLRRKSGYSSETPAHAGTCAASLSSNPSNCRRSAADKHASIAASRACKTGMYRA